MKKSMNVLCATDKNFLNPTYVTMWSIIKNHKNIPINFFLFTASDVTNEDKKNLKDFISSHNCTISYIDVKESLYSDYVVCERFPRAAYYRLMAHEYLPKNIDRVLYLDVDIVVNQNIYEDFYSLDFEDKYLIATSHNPNPNYCNMLTSSIVNLESAAKGEYFNSGVLLMNLKRFREKNITIQTYNKAYTACENAGFKIFYDQGLLNYMFYDKTKYFSSMDYNFRYSIPIQNARRLEENREYKKAIIHYTGMCQPYKPWDLKLTEDEVETFGTMPFSDDYFYVNKELNDLCNIWWDYAKETPIYDQVYYEMSIKHKWFKRNIMNFALKHNDLVKKLQFIKQEPSKKQGFSKNNNYLIPNGFHFKAYKIGCIICSPYFLLKKIINKLKNKKKKQK